MFKIPSVGKAEEDEMKAKKETARKEWLHVVLRTRELTPDLKKRIEANNLFLCVNFILKQSSLLIVSIGSLPSFLLRTICLMYGNCRSLFYALNIYKAAYKLNIRIKGQSIKTLLCFFIDGKCKTLDTGAVQMKQSPVANIVFLYNKKAFLRLLRPPSRKRKCLINSQDI